MHSIIALSWAFDHLVTLPAIAREIARTAILQGEGRAATARVIVVVLKHVAEGGQRLFIRIAQAMTHNLHIRAIGIHSHRKSRSPDMAVIRGPTRSAKMIGWPIRPTITIGASHEEGLARFVGEDRPAVSIVEIELPIRPCREGMQGVIVIDRVEPC